MKVSVQYAENHFSEILPISSESVIQTPSSGSARRGLWGSGKGQIWMAEDWNSPTTNTEIADLFNDGPIFPDESGA